LSHNDKNGMLTDQTELCSQPTFAPSWPTITHNKTNTSHRPYFTVTLAISQHTCLIITAVARPALSHSVKLCCCWYYGRQTDI